MFYCYTKVTFPLPTLFLLSNLSTPTKKKYSCLRVRMAEMAL